MTSKPEEKMSAEEMADEFAKQLAPVGSQKFTQTTIGFLAGHSSRDAEVKELVQALSDALDCMSTPEIHQDKKWRSEESRLYKIWEKHNARFERTGK